jgi:hypothetical protein
MGKYEPLARLLSETSNDELSASFGDVEDILGFKLPPSARDHRPWWANSYKGSHSQAQGWIGAGWETRDIDMKRERVRFVRTGSAGRSNRGFENLGLWDKARSLTGITDRMELEVAAVRALIQQTAAHELAKLGGTMPDAKAAPRERRSL